jgi:hypothetical protein
MSKLDDSVKQGDDGWDFTCPAPPGTCGDPNTGAPFTSTGWPTKKIAQARASQHLDEHLGKGVMPDLDAFRAKHLNPDGTARR